MCYAPQDMVGKPPVAHIKRWSGRMDHYRIESYAIKDGCLVLDRPDGVTTLIPWRQIVEVNIDPWRS